MTCCCRVCGVLFTSKVIDFRHADGKNFYCPNGHVLSYANALEREETDKEVADLKKLFENSPD